MNHCTYTAQGQMVCTLPKQTPYQSNTQEMFIDEIGNDDLAQKKSSSSVASEAVLESTAKLIKSGSFCQVTMYLDPATKTMKVYNFVKECPTTQQLNESQL